MFLADQIWQEYQLVKSSFKIPRGFPTSSETSQLKAEEANIWQTKINFGHFQVVPDAGVQEQITKTSMKGVEETYSALSSGQKQGKQRQFKERQSHMTFSVIISVFPFSNLQEPGNLVSQGGWKQDFLGRETEKDVIISHPQMPIFNFQPDAGLS